MDPLVSIPILCHDYGRFLGEAIESALAQSYPRVEVVVWDDGSTDDTRDVAARYSEVELVSQENAGLVRTCNRAVWGPRYHALIFSHEQRQLCGAGAACDRSSGKPSLQPQSVPHKRLGSNSPSE